jgi:hypothetical protein
MQDPYDSVAVGLVEVLHKDRVEHDGCTTPRGYPELFFEPVRCVCFIYSRRDLLGNFKSGPEAPHSPGLIAPNK